MLSAALAPHLAVVPLVAYGIGFGCVAGAAIMAAATVPRVRPRALWLLMIPIAWISLVGESGASGLAASVGVAVGLLAGGSLLGAIVGGAVDHAGYLVFVAVVSSAMDLVSVFHPTGPSAMIAASPRALSLVAVPWPMFGTPAIEAFLGVGDVVFTSLYVSACRRHRLSESHTLVALVLAYVAAAGMVIALEHPVPALPLLGAAVVGMHPEARRPPPAERRRGIAVTTMVVLACFGILVSRFR